MKPLLIMFALVVVHALIVSPVHSQVDVEQVRSAARTQLGAFLARIPSGQELTYGFHSRSEFGEATPGEPYEVFTLESAGDRSTVGPLLKSLNEWRVPVCVRGEFRALLTVAMVHGSWRAVDFGATELAKELDGYEQQYSRSPRTQHRGILRLFASGCDLVLTYDRSATIDAAEVYPLASARRALAQQGLPAMEQLSVRQSLPLLMRLPGASESLRK